MPCQYESHEETIQRMYVQINDLTRWLCAACETLASSVGLPTEPGLGEWWIEHQRRDLERVRRDAEAEARKALKQQALAKLSPEERDALKA